MELNVDSSLYVPALSVKTDWSKTAVLSNAISSVAINCFFFNTLF